MNVIICVVRSSSLHTLYHMLFVLYLFILVHSYRISVKFDQNWRTRMVLKGLVWENYGKFR